MSFVSQSKFISAALLSTLFGVMFARPALSGVYEHFLFNPMVMMREPIAVDGADCRPLTLKQDDNEISCWYYKKNNDSGLVLVSHGNGGNMSHMAGLVPHLLKDTNCSVLLYDYRGYGASSGKPTARGILKEGVAAFDFAVADLGYKPKQITLYGESLGCAVSCYIAKQREPRAIILQSGFRSLPAIAKDLFRPLRFIPNFVFPEPRLNNEKLLKTAHAPLLIMHGKKDKLIPFGHAEALFKAASEPKTIVALEHSGHNDTYRADSDAFDRAIVDFMENLQKGQSP